MGAAVRNTSSEHSAVSTQPLNILFRLNFYASRRVPRFTAKGAKDAKEMTDKTMILAQAIYQITHLQNQFRG